MKQEKKLREILSELQRIQAKCFGHNFTFEISVKKDYFHVYVCERYNGDTIVRSYSFYDFYSEIRLEQILGEIKALPIVALCL